MPRGKHATDPGSLSARTEKRLDIIADLAQKYKNLFIADAPLDNFRALAAEYEMNGLRYLPSSLVKRIGSRLPDAERRVLTILSKYSSLRREDMAGDLGISLEELRPIIKSISDHGLIIRRRDRYSLTSLGREEMEKK